MSPSGMKKRHRAQRLHFRLPGGEKRGLSVCCEGPGSVPGSRCLSAVSAEEVRKLKARVDELERIRSGVSQYEEELIKRSNQERLQGLAPSAGGGLGTSGLDGHSQEALWLFVRNKLMTEQENGEHSHGKGPAPPAPCPFASVCSGARSRSLDSHAPSALSPLYSPGWKEGPVL